MSLEPLITEKGMAEGSFPFILFSLTNILVGGSFLILAPLQDRKQQEHHQSEDAGEHLCSTQAQQSSEADNHRQRRQAFYSTSASWINCLKCRKKNNSWSGGIGCFLEGQGHLRGRGTENKANAQIITQRLLFTNSEVLSKHTYTHTPIHGGWWETGGE